MLDKFTYESQKWASPPNLSSRDVDCLILKPQGLHRSSMTLVFDEHFNSYSVRYSACSFDIVPWFQRLGKLFPLIVEAFQRHDKDGDGVLAKSEPWFWITALSLSVKELQNPTGRTIMFSVASCSLIISDLSLSFQYVFIAVRCRESFLFITALWKSQCPEEANIFFSLFVSERLNWGVPFAHSSTDPILRHSLKRFCAQYCKFIWIY